MNIPDKIVSFTDINAWKEGHKLVINVYKITNSFPKSETYSMVDQMKGASSSVTANIAEQANTTHKLLQGLLQKTKTFLNPNS